MKKLLSFNTLKWVASILGLLGAIMIALNVEESKYAFIFFILSSIIWTYAGIKVKDWALASLNVGFFIVNIIGIYRWIV